MLYDFPIENLDQRYSTQWRAWFAEEYDRLGVSWLRVDPEHRPAEKIVNGQFLDVVHTNIYKAKQLQTFLAAVAGGAVKLHDVVMLHDLWFPGLEMLFYVRDALKLPIHICGYLHAGTYDPWDFLSRQGMNVWGRELEQSWFRGVDRIFLHSDFHERLLLSKRFVERSKIRKVGFPFRLLEPKWVIGEKKDIVVFPHRLAPEKQPEIFDTLRNELADTLPGWQFIKTQDTLRTKDEYYALLQSAKISFSASLQETWGISMQESVIHGCIPVVPARLAYLDVYDKKFQYHNYEHAVTLIKQFAENYSHVVLSEEFASTGRRLREMGDGAIEKIVTEIRAFGGRC